jgi:hypothetical protein
MRLRKCALKVGKSHSDEILKKLKPGMTNDPFRVSDASNRTREKQRIDHYKFICKDLLPPSKPVFKIPLSKPPKISNPIISPKYKEDALAEGLVKRRPEAFVSDEKIQEEKPDISNHQSIISVTQIFIDKSEQNYSLQSSKTLLPKDSPVKVDPVAKKRKPNVSSKLKDLPKTISSIQKPLIPQKNTGILAFQDEPDDFRRWIQAQSELLRFKGSNNQH